MCVSVVSGFQQREQAKTRGRRAAFVHNGMLGARRRDGPPLVALLGLTSLHIYALERLPDTTMQSRRLPITSHFARCNLSVAHFQARGVSERAAREENYNLSLDYDHHGAHKLRVTCKARAPFPISGRVQRAFELDDKICLNS